MKDMGRCGHVALCAILLFYCSIVTASSHLSVKRKDGVSEVNMTSVLQTMEMDFSNQTQPPVNNTSTESTPHANTTAGIVVNSTTPMEDISFSNNVTASQNKSDVSHVQNHTAANTTTPTILLPFTTHKSPTSLSATIHTMTTASSRTTHSSNPESRADLSSTATQNAQTTTNSSSPIQARAHMDTPSELNIGDDDSNKVSTDPLLAGLVSAFVVVAAIVSVLVFLKFRNINSGPEFRRLQDLPMDDMMEDAPLSMYSY